MSFWGKKPNVNPFKTVTPSINKQKIRNSIKERQTLALKYLRSLSKYIDNAGNEVTQAGQCFYKDPSKYEYITQKDDFRRSLLFFKRVKEKKPILLTEKSLPLEEEIQFINEWKAGLQNNTSNPVDWVDWSVYTFLGIPRTVSINGKTVDIDISDVDTYYSEFTHGIETDVSANIFTKKPSDNLLLAFDCNKKANARQGVISRFIMDIKMDPIMREYSMEYAEFVAGNSTYTLNYNIPLSLNNINVTFTYDIDDFVPTDMNTVVPIRDVLYIHINNNRDILPQKIYIIKGQYLQVSRLLKDMISSNIIIDIHPQLIYLLYSNINTRKLLVGSNAIMKGKLVPDWINATNIELAVFYWTLCWNIYNYMDTTSSNTFYSKSYTEKINIIHKILNSINYDSKDNIINSVIRTVNWSIGKMKSGDIYKHFNILYKTLFEKIGDISVNITEGVQSSIIMPYVRELQIIDFKKQCDSKKLINIEKMPVLNIVGAFKRALVFWKYTYDKLPIPLMTIALPPDEEIDFINRWHSRIVNVSDEYKVSESLNFLGLSNSIIEEYETNFNNKDTPLLYFNCKVRIDGTMTFDHIIKCINKTNEERQYYFEEKYLNQTIISCGTLANSANNLTTLSFISSEKDTVDYDCDPKKNTALTSTYNDTLYVLTTNDIKYQDRPNKSYNLPGNMLLKASLPYDIFKNKKVLDIHPKVAYFMWKDLTLRNTFFIPCFGNNFLPPTNKLRELRYYSYNNTDKDDFAKIYYKLCYDTAATLPLAERITFYKSSNIKKYTKIIIYLKSQSGYKINTINKNSRPISKGFFSNIFTRSKKPMLQKWRNTVRKIYTGRNIPISNNRINASNSLVLEELLRSIEPSNQYNRSNLQLGAGHNKNTHKNRKHMMRKVTYKYRHRI